MPSLNVMLIIIPDAVISFNPCLPIHRCKPYEHSTGKMTVASLLDFFPLPERKEYSCEVQ